MFRNEIRRRKRQRRDERMALIDDFDLDEEIPTETMVPCKNLICP